MEKKDSESNTIVEFIICVIVLYFAWRAAPMAGYMDGVTPYLTSDDHNGTSKVMGYIYEYGAICLFLLTILLPISVFVELDEDESIIGVFLLLWPILGWWIGRSYEKAHAEKLLCEQGSFWGLGCTTDAPLFSYLAFCAIGILLTVYVAFSLLGKWLSD